MSNPPNQTDAESLAAEELAQKGDPAADVLQWLHESHFGVLSTLNIEKSATGFPTGSIVPFALDDLGRPFVFIADIALHTRNLRKDNRASLFIHKQAADGDPQSHWRISLRGRFRALSVADDKYPNDISITEDEWERLMARYIARVPKARSYAKMHGFRFWRIEEMQSIRYIKGFGRICTFSGEDYLKLVGEEAYKPMRQGAMSHMNDDHEEQLDINRHVCFSLFAKFSIFSGCNNGCGGHSLLALDL